MLRKFLIVGSLSVLGIAYADSKHTTSGGFSHNPQTQVFINLMVKKHHFNKTQLEYLFSQIKVRPKVIQHVKAPVENNPWYAYRKLYVTNERIAGGVKFWQRYHKTLARAQKVYGVPASVIVATIGVESLYGRVTGKYPVIDALANLAFGSDSRPAYFRKELEDFLLLTREQHLNPLKVMGSYAGAIGQPQFMPSSYRHYAVNFSGKAGIDLMNDEVDVIGSVANYYKKMGWEAGQAIVVPATTRNGKLVPSLKISTKIHKQLIELKNRNNTEYWYALPNFYAIKRYNHSTMYAMAVYQLSFYISKTYGVKHVTHKKKHT